MPPTVGRQGGAQPASKPITLLVSGLESSGKQTAPAASKGQME